MHAGNLYARGGAVRGAIAGGLGLGALGAAVNGLPKTQKNILTGEEEKLTNKQRITRGVVGGLGFGVLGAMHGRRMGWNHRAKKWNAGFRPAAGAPGGMPKPKTPDWLKGAKTRSEARRAYHAQARKLHPDLGGNPEAIKNLNVEWEKHEPMFKQALYDAFADELEKIASLGALAGGYAGYKLAPKSPKGKLYGALGGAAVGHLAGKGLSVAKQEILDRPAQRERQELYGYVSPPNNPNF